MTAWRYEISLLVSKKYFTRSLRSFVKYFSTLQEKFCISACPCTILYISYPSTGSNNPSRSYFSNGSNNVTHPDHILPQRAQMTHPDHILPQRAQMTHPDHILPQPALMTHSDHILPQPALMTHSDHILV